jgi:hypothetical protein
MSNPTGYAELNKTQMANFLFSHSKNNDIAIDQIHVKKLVDGIFEEMKKKYLKLDAARDFYALMRHKNGSFELFMKKINSA